MSSQSSTPFSLTDFLIKVILPIVGCVIAVLTLYFSVLRDKDQSQDKKVELRQKDAELFHKQSDLQRARETVKAEFLQKNFSLLSSSDPVTIRHAEALIDGTFATPEDALDVKTKARRIRDSASEPGTQAAPERAAQFKALGFKYAKGHYHAEAAFSFDNAVALAPKDAQAWNALAYAQLHLGKVDDAYTSISKAIEFLAPSDTSLGSVVAINAAKILCAQGKADPARTYLNVAIDLNQELLARVKGDGELLHMCAIKFR